MKEGRSKELLDGTRRHGKIRVPWDRFLRSRLGKSWDKILSEISREFGKNSRERSVFLRVIDWQVQQKCWKGAESGKIFTPVGVEVVGFYVHPLSGCLQFREPVKEKRPEEPVVWIKIDKVSAYSKEKGIWYHVKYVKNDYYAPWRSKDVEVSEDLRELYAKEFITSKKRQLNSKELKELGLKNDPPEEPKHSK